MEPVSKVPDDRPCLLGPLARARNPPCCLRHPLDTCTLQRMMQGPSTVRHPTHRGFQVAYAVMPALALRPGVCHAANPDRALASQRPAADPSTSVTRAYGPSTPFE